MEPQANRAEKLAAQYLAGDRRAMEDLIREIQDGVYYHCVKILRNESDAQDAAQDVLTAVLRDLDGLKSPAAFRSWLNRIIARTCMRTYAREHREIPMSESAEDPLFENLDDQRIPEKIIDTEETRRMIRELVDELPPAQKLCVLMYYYDELPVKDIAEVIDAPENTVKSRLNYARKAIKAGVDRWIAQGLTLYSFTPLPYLRYFLQKESEDCRLPPVVVMRIQEALLAAGAVGAAAAGSAGGGTLTGATAGGAAAAGLVQNGALALAGLLLAGSVGGLLLHDSVRQPDGLRGPEPPPVVETIPAPEEPEVLEYLPEPSEAAETISTPAGPETPGRHPGTAIPSDAPASYTEERAEHEPPAEEDSGDSGGGSAPAPLPGEDPAPEPEPAPTPDPAPGPDSDSEPDLAPDPGTGPEPEPEPGPDPVSPAPAPPVDDFYQPNYDFGTYLGRNEEGVYEFDVRLLADRETWSHYPLEVGNYYARMEVSDESRVGLRAQYIYGKVPGTCEISYYVSTTPEGPFELKVIVHVTVEPEEPITLDYDWGEYQGMRGTVARFRRTLIKGDYEDKGPLNPGQYYVKAESGDSNVVEVTWRTRLRAVGAGTATVRYYTRWAESDPWVESAVADVTVLDEAPPEPEVAGRQTLHVGYGYNGSFTGIWQGELPQALNFTSSKASVVYIHPTGGGFSALSPGTAGLTAYDPLEPDLLYVLEVQVDDAFQWEYAAEDMTLSVGKSQVREVEYTLQSVNEIHLSSASVTSSSPYVAAVTMEPDSVANDQIRFEIKGLAPGTAEMEGRAVFEVLTYDGLKPMEADFSFQIQVDEPPEADIPTVRKELEQFGYCSGYGYTGSFSNVWDGELPEDLTYVSSDPAVAYIVEGGAFSTLSAGTAVLTAASTSEPACRYELTLHVEDRLDCVRTMEIEEDTACPEAFNTTPAPSYRDFNGTLDDIKWTSSDPEILTVTGESQLSCTYRVYRIGKAALNGTATFEINTVDGTRRMKDSFSIPITAEYLKETKAVEPEEFGLCSGYGYTGSFEEFFPGLPDGLTFHSSDLAVASIHLNDGRFSTLNPGRVLLYAYDSSGHQYAVWLNVQNAMEWTYSLEGMTLDVGGSGLNGLTDVQLHEGVKLSSAFWLPTDFQNVFVEQDEDNPLLCRVEAIQAGTAVVNGRLTFQAPDYLYTDVSSYSLRVTVSFPVTIRLPGQTNSDTPPDI